jgi:hypothetical protein
MGQLAWHVADMLELPFDSASFDAVVEKGTMDVLFVDNDSPWSPRPEVCARVERMLDETHRCRPLNLCSLSAFCQSQLCFSSAHLLPYVLHPAPMTPCQSVAKLDNSAQDVACLGHALPQLHF